MLPVRLFNSIAGVFGILTLTSAQLRLRAFQTVWTAERHLPSLVSSKSNLSNLSRERHAEVNQYGGPIICAAPLRRGKVGVCCCRILSHEKDLLRQQTCPIHCVFLRVVVLLLLATVLQRFSMSFIENSVN
eukprot:441335-Amphidinium_carterae.1